VVGLLASFPASTVHVVGSGFDWLDVSRLRSVLQPVDGHVLLLRHSHDNRERQHDNES
jgi:hypothetical protein